MIGTCKSVLGKGENKGQYCGNVHRYCPMKKSHSKQYYYILTAMPKWVTLKYENQIWRYKKPPQPPSLLDIPVA